MTPRDLLGFLPLGLVAAGVIGTGYVTLERQANLRAEVEDLSESNDELEDDVQRLRMQVLEGQGDTKSMIATIQGDVKMVLRMLEDERGRP